MNGLSKECMGWLGNWERKGEESNWSTYLGSYMYSLVNPLYLSFRPIFPWYKPEEAAGKIYDAIIKKDESI